MKNRNLTTEDILCFQKHLIREEKSAATVEKYIRDSRTFLLFLSERPLSKDEVISYKQKLIEEKYAVTSINSMLISVNSLLRFLGREDIQVNILKTQCQTYSPEEKELKKEEYFRLIKTAGKESRLGLVLQTICGTGIRVSELKYFTVEAVRKGEVTVRCKNKIRTILIPRKLKHILLKYAKKKGIGMGIIFRTRTGNALDRSNIWAEMKKICQMAGINPKKVFPHNLRKLFARTFYKIKKDIAKLADVLGHTNVNTTRIYIMTTGQEHRRQIEKMGLVV